jgi:signal transduction histidine kinase
MNDPVLPVRGDEWERGSHPATMLSLVSVAVAATALLGVRLTEPDGLEAALRSGILVAMLWLAPLGLHAFRGRLEPSGRLGLVVLTVPVLLLLIWSSWQPGNPGRVPVELLAVVPYAALFIRLPFRWTAALGVVAFLAAGAVVLTALSKPYASLVSVAFLVALGILTVWRTEIEQERRARYAEDLCAHIAHLQRVQADLKEAHRDSAHAHHKHTVAQEAARLQYESRLRQLEQSHVELTSAKAQLEQAYKLAKRRAADAQAANESKNDFLQKVAHDLRQPLFALGQSFEAARIHLERGRYDDVERVFPTISQAFKALSSTFSAMLDISKLESGMVKPAIEPLDLGQLLDDIAKQYLPVAEDKGVQLIVRPVKEPCYVDSNREWLWRILVNLVSNAVKFTHPDEGRRAVVRVRAVHVGSEVRVDVLDTGIGIEAQALDRIWDQFFKVDDSDDGEPSSGLGLSIVRAASRALGHRIEFESWPGRGSLFSISMRASALQPMTSQVHVDTDTRVDLSGHRVIVVDDHPLARQGLVSLLEAWGVKATCFSDVAELKRFLTETGGLDPSALITDFRLGNGTTGSDVLQLVRSALRQDLPAIVLTGWQYSTVPDIFMKTRN